MVDLRLSSLRGCGCATVCKMAVSYSPPNLRLIRALMHGAAILLSLAGTALGADAPVRWANSAGGNFFDLSNWIPQVIPVATDIAQFDLESSYPILLGDGVTNRSVWVDSGSVTQQVGNWTILENVALGREAARTGRLAIISGKLTVTNITSSARITVGGAGIGELRIDGGSVVADRLTANARDGSILTLIDGELTARAGFDTDLGRDLVLGDFRPTIPGRTTHITLNIEGGHNTIAAGQFEYGVLTMGTDGRLGRPGGSGTLRLSGPNSSLSLPSIDSYGGNRLFITNGARLLTRSVQWGVGSGSNNLIHISGPGSSWVNYYLMYHGMHSGGQTMVVTNGGTFRTGGTDWGDQHFTAFDNSNNRIIISGEGSRFVSAGPTEFGQIWSIDPIDLNNVLRIENGGAFQAGKLYMGGNYWPPYGYTARGTLLDAADGMMSIQSLEHYVGHIRVGMAKGYVGELEMRGGTNAVLEASDEILIGARAEDVGAGDVIIGQINVSLPSLRGELRGGNVRLAWSPGSAASVTLTNQGRIWAAKGDGSGTLSVGEAGQAASLVAQGGSEVHAENIIVGPAAALTAFGDGAVISGGNLMAHGAEIVVRDGATLRFNRLGPETARVAISDGTLEFGVAAPEFAPGAARLSNSTLSFRNVTDAGIGISAPSAAGRATRTGSLTLRFVQSTNAPVDELRIVAGSATDWNKIEFLDGASRINATGFFLSGDAVLACTNATVRIAAATALEGRLALASGTVVFAEKVTLGREWSISGSNAFVIFEGELELPETDVIVPDGITVRVGTVSTRGGRLTVAGGGITPPLDEWITNPLLRFSDGWLTYVDRPDAPLTRPEELGTGAWLGLRLSHSTNAPISLGHFSDAEEFAGLELANGSLWRSDELTIGRGGLLRIKDTTSRLDVSSRTLRLADGGTLVTEMPVAAVGFRLNAANQKVIVSGQGSSWTGTGLICVGTNRNELTSNNSLLVENGAKIRSASGAVGGYNSWDNVAIIRGPGSEWRATNSFTVFQGVVSILGGGLLETADFRNRGDMEVAGSGSSLTAANFEVTYGKLEVLDGASIHSATATVSPYQPITLSGAGVIWTNSQTFTVAHLDYYSALSTPLAVRASAKVKTDMLTLSNLYSNGKAFLLIAGGEVNANAVHATGRIDVTNNGVFRARNFSAGSAENLELNFRHGRISWGGSDLPLGTPLNLGERPLPVELELTGGMHTWRGGARINRGAILGGSGDITGNLSISGRFRPRSIRLQGILGVDSFAQVEIIANRDGPSLMLSSPVELNGMLLVSLPPDVSPTENDIFVAMSAPAITGDFLNAMHGSRIATENGLGSFRVERSAMEVRLVDFQSEDLDHDGINDGWARSNFGASPLPEGNLSGSLDGDLDADGLSNRIEFMFRFDPRSANSSLGLRAGLTPEGRATVSFHPPAAGWWRVQSSADLRAWENYSEGEYFVTPAGRVALSSLANVGARFFRVVVE